MAPMRSTVRLNTNGRVVVPHPIREELGVDRGDLVEIEVRPVGDEEGRNE